MPALQCLPLCPSCPWLGIESQANHSALCFPLPSALGHLLQFFLFYSFVGQFEELIGIEVGQMGLDRGTAHRNMYIWKNRTTVDFL